MAWFWWVLLCLAVVFALILATRITFAVIYDKPGVHAFVKVGFLRFTVYPKAEKGKEKKKPKKEKQKTEEKAKGGTVSKLKGGLKVIGPILQQVKRRLVIAKLTLHYTAATNDAAKTAFAYAGAHMAVNQIMPMLHGNFKVKQQDVQIKGDFTQAEDSVYLDARIRISVWAALTLGLFVYKQLKKVGIITTKEKKEGTTHEREKTSN